MRATADSERAAEKRKNGQRYLHGNQCDDNDEYDDGEAKSLFDQFGDPSVGFADFTDDQKAKAALVGAAFVGLFSLFNIAGRIPKPLPSRMGSLSALPVSPSSTRVSSREWAPLPS